MNAIGRLIKRFLFPLTALLLSGFPSLEAAETGSAERPLRVGVWLDEPFVERADTGGYKGFAIDIWEQVAAQNNWKFEYVELNSIAALLEAVENGRVDIGATDITVTKARLARVDFSMPFMDAGFLIMVNDTAKELHNQLWKAIVRPDHLRILGAGAALILSIAFIVTLFERRLNSEFPSSWVEGYVESFYHVMSVAFTGKTNHKGIPGPVGKFFAAIWLATGVAVVALITSIITSSMTVSKLNGTIRGPQDLPGKTVGTIQGTVGQTYCESRELAPRLFPSVSEAVKSLVRREIDCIVYDAPVLLYYDNIHPELPISEVGPVINKAPYAFAFASGSQLRAPFNRALYHLEEHAVLKKLREHYFGQD